ncbi:MAG: ABC transporter permease subunit [Pirellulales bacterium]
MTLAVVVSNWIDPLGWIFGWAALVAFGLYLAFMGFREVAPKLAAIMQTTAKESISQPLFLVLLLIGTALLVASTFIPYNTFGEDIKMLKSSGVTTIKLLSMFLGLWTASLAIAEEIEGRTALTLLSKPVSRLQFILGKFLGVLVPVAAMFLILGVVFLCTVSKKVAYDARENSQEPPTVAQCLAEVKMITPYLFVSFLEVVMLVSIIVAISTRLPMLPNLIICLSVYILGHLLPLLVQSTEAGLEPVRFVAQLIAVVVPNLDHFNINPPVFRDMPIPKLYLGWTTAYAAIYTLFALVGALFLFEDRDLA